MEHTLEENELAFLSKKILELNEKLIESEKAKSRFLSLVASELNNPMTAFLGIIPHLKIQEGEHNREIFGLLYKEALNLDFRIQNLVMTTEIESGNMDVTYALLEPREIIDEVTESLKYLLNEKSMTIKLTSTLEQKIVSDPKKLYSILKNLISNGCQYGLANSAIEINFDIKESMFVMSVKNEGQAPNLKYKAEIFTRFVKDMHGEHGLGLGLSIVRELCERLDGNIDYISENGFVTFIAKVSMNQHEIDSQAYGSNEFLFESFENTIEL